MQSSDEHSDKFEPEPQNLQAGIQIRGLTKLYPAGGRCSGKKDKVCFASVSDEVTQRQIVPPVGYSDLNFDCSDWGVIPLSY